MLTNTYLTLQKPVTAISTLQILGNLILIANHEKDTVIIPTLQVRKLKIQKLIYLHGQISSISNVNVIIGWVLQKADPDWILASRKFVSTLRTKNL